MIGSACLTAINMAAIFTHDFINIKIFSLPSSSNL